MLESGDVLKTKIELDDSIEKQIAPFRTDNQLILRRIAEGERAFAFLDIATAELISHLINFESEERATKEEDQSDKEVKRWSAHTNNEFVITNAPDAFVNKIIHDVRFVGGSIDSMRQEYEKEH